jgi:hypothetical protein
VDCKDYQTNKEDFAEIYRDVEQLLPHRMPLPRGRSVVVTAYVDASHGAKKVTRTSHTGYVVFINRAPVVWCRKQHNTVETSTFSTEFIALNICSGLLNIYDLSYDASAYQFLKANQLMFYVITKVL